MVAHEALAAVPLSAAPGTPDPDLVQALLINRYLYFLGSAENPQTFDPTNTAGAIVQVIAFNGKLFWYDALDATTAHDGTTTLVTAGGERFKIEGVNTLVRSVLDKDLTSPPGSPSLGDTYIVGTAATGDWATHDDEIAIWTARGWEFITPGTGWLIYVADEAKHYSFSSGGAWVEFGGIAANSVLPANVVGGRSHWVIVNDTTDDPPVAPQGTAYIIGDTPTGAWAGHARKIAFRETAGSNDTYTIIAPVKGWTAHDQADNTDLIYDGSTWVSAAGAVVAFVSTFIATGSTTFSGGVAYVYSATTAPLSSAAKTEDNNTITHAAKRAGAKLRLKWQGVLTVATNRAIALFRDTETNAIDWVAIDAPENGHLQFEAIVTAPDTNSHTYKIIVMANSVGLERRTFTLEEFA